MRPSDIFKQIQDSIDDIEMLVEAAADLVDEISPKIPSDRAGQIMAKVGEHILNVLNPLSRLYEKSRHDEVKRRGHLLQELSQDGVPFEHGIELIKLMQSRNETLVARLQAALWEGVAKGAKESQTKTSLFSGRSVQDIMKNIN